MIELRHLTKRHDDVAVVDGLTFTVIRGELLVLLGTSGSGKTTLYTINRLIEPSSGSVLIEGGSRIVLELPETVEALAALVGTNDANAMRRMNLAVDRCGESPAAVARRFLDGR